jgi:hypothetical protein
MIAIKVENMSYLMFTRRAITYMSDAQQPLYWIVIGPSKIKNGQVDLIEHLYGGRKGFEEVRGSRVAG